MGRPANGKKDNGTFEEISNRSNTKGDEILCPTCEISFTQKKALYAHVRRFHSSNQSSRHLLPLGNLICGLCNDKFKNMASLQEHITIDHPEVPLSFVEKTFYCDEDFLAWKKNLEIATKCVFVVDHSSPQVSGFRKARYYYCHRSSRKRKNKGVMKLRRRKSHKIPSTCPANMKVYKEMIHEATEIKVYFQSVHVGHEVEKRYDEIQNVSELNNPSNKVPEQKVSTSAEVLVDEGRRSEVLLELEKWKTMVQECKVPEQLTVLTEVLNLVKENWQALESLSLANHV